MFAKLDIPVVGLYAGVAEGSFVACQAFGVADVARDDDLGTLPSIVFEGDDGSGLRVGQRRSSVLSGVRFAPSSTLGFWAKGRYSSIATSYRPTVVPAAPR